MPKYQVAGLPFETKAAVRAHARRILNGGPLGSVVAEPDERFIYAMLMLREDKVTAIADKQILRYERDAQPGPLSRTRCIWVVCTDGSRLDFSLNKALDLLSPRVDPLEPVFRKAS